MRVKLFNEREKRIHPYKDDKILTSWNGLMISAMAIGGRVLSNDKYVEAAEKAVEFILSRLVRNDGRLLARYRDREAAYPGYIDDYAFLVWGLIELYETTYKPKYLQYAIRFNNEMIKCFWDNENYGLFLYGNDSEQLIARPKEIYDGATPSGNSVATMNFLRLARITGDTKLEELADKQFKVFSNIIKQAPRGYTHFLMAAMFALYPTREIVFVGDKSEKNMSEMIRVIHNIFLPNTVSILKGINGDTKELQKIVTFIDEQKQINDKATAYVCENYSCKAPITDKEELVKMMEQH